MVHGPDTQKSLDDSLPGVKLVLSPTTSCSQRYRGHTATTSPPAKRSSSRPWAVTVFCGGCKKKLKFAVKTTVSTVTEFEHLLTKDLDFLCPYCDKEERHGRG
ncbi:E7 [Bos taurus papillomavirus 14]|uniref:E7 n=1 Tax=Bos taurus papillomavirus 14 TaxID=2758381 RepID=A0A0E3SZI0_BPV1|nr:E7 [Bos taurus papillomavirus 14]ALL29331.1 E7 [Bos taurus papillomavirus 14]